MNRNTPLAPARVPETALPATLWTDVTVKSAEMLWSSTEVIGARLVRMLRAGPMPSARDRHEFALMGAEKLEAAQASVLAVGEQVKQAQLDWIARLTPTTWHTWWDDALAGWGMQADLARMTGAALAPIHAVATSNARRLTRVKSTA